MTSRKWSKNKWRDTDCQVVSESIMYKFKCLANKSLSRKSDYSVTLFVENERNLK